LNENEYKITTKTHQQKQKVPFNEIINLVALLLSQGNDQSPLWCKQVHQQQ
jgi:hypothetical protein